MRSRGGGLIILA